VTCTIFEDMKKVAAKGARRGFEENKLLLFFHSNLLDSTPKKGAEKQYRRRCRSEGRQEDSRPGKETKKKPSTGRGVLGGRGLVGGGGGQAL